METLQLLASGVLPLFCLAVGDVGQYASQAFCHQDVAADGAYSSPVHQQNDFVSLDLEQICSGLNCGLSLNRCISLQSLPLHGICPSVLTSALACCSQAPSLSR